MSTLKEYEQKVWEILLEQMAEATVEKAFEGVVENCDEKGALTYVSDGETVTRADNTRMEAALKIVRKRLTILAGVGHTWSPEQIDDYVDGEPTPNAEALAEILGDGEDAPQAQEG